MVFQFEQHRLGLRELSWDLIKKNNLLGNGIRTPYPRPPFQDPLISTHFVHSPYTHILYFTRLVVLAPKALIRDTCKMQYN